jgi:hypothetical protein
MCKPKHLFYLLSPEGAYAVVTKHGEFMEIKRDGGMFFCLPYVTITP